MIDEFKEELKVVQGVFLSGKEQVSESDAKAPVYHHLPAIVQKLTWAQSL